tara:strand:- start:184 stop:1890 length:1707 start_codon:yes stop_codon:yes gene_type:complete
MFGIIFKVLKNDFNKLSIFSLIILMSLGSILEIFSIGLIIPLISSLTVDNIDDILFFDHINLFFDINSKKEFFNLIVISLIVFFTSKFIFLSFLTLKLNKFIAEANRVIPIRLLNIYLKKNFEWLTNENRSNFIHTVFAEVNNFCGNALYGFLFLTAEILNIIGIIFVLTFFNIKFFISVFILLTIFFPTLYFFTKKISHELGKKRLETDRNLMTILNENLKGIKEFLIYERSKVLYESFNKLKIKLKKIQFLHDSLQEGTRHVIEFVGIIILIIIIILSSSNIISDGKETIIILGVYAVAFVRILPSLNRMSTYAQRFRYGITSGSKIISIYDEEYVDVLQDVKNINFNESINLQNINFKFQNKNDLLLKKINISIKKNSVIGIVGESGSGKTTLSNLIMGLMKPNEGKILVDGKDIHANNLSIQNKIGFVSQNFFALDDNVLNNITLGDKKVNYSNLKFALKNSIIDKAIRKKQIRLRSNIGELGLKISGGQLQRISIARALYRRPELLILDEPSSSLDVENQKLLIDILKGLKNKMTIILISHQESLTSVCDKIYKIENGTILND